MLCFHFYSSFLYGVQCLNYGEGRTLPNSVIHPSLHHHHIMLLLLLLLPLSPYNSPLYVKKLCTNGEGRNLMM